MTSLLVRLPELLLALGLALVLLVVMGSRPRVFVVLWIAAVCLIPWWVGFTVRQFFPVSALVSLAGLLCMVPTPIKRITLPDWGVAAFFIACLTPIVAGGSTSSGTFTAFFIWLPAYIAGRRIAARVTLQWVYGVVAVMFTVVSLLAIAEFVLVWNPFVGFHHGNAFLYETWSPLQQRGGILRAEGAFGHSIALGSSLALAIPMTLASSFRPSLRLVAVGLMLGGSVVTFSRSGMICSVLSLVVSILVMRDRTVTRRLRKRVLWLLAVMAVALVPFILQIFSAAGTEATRSSSYRDSLTSLIPKMNWVGISDAVQHLPDGEVYFGTFRSIDSQLILTGLTYGKFAVLVGCVLLVAAIGLVLRARATAPMIAVACQLPSLLTVALITQYSILFWFTVGLAVAAQSAARNPDPEQTLPLDVFSVQNNTAMAYSSSGAISQKTG